MLMPPSIGIQGGGQQGGPAGGPGCEKQVTENNNNITPSMYLVMRIQKYVFIYFK